MSELKRYIYNLLHINRAILFTQNEIMKRTIRITSTNKTRHKGVDNMLRNAAKVFGVVLLLIGVLGFVPGLTDDNHLLGIFHVDFLHNLVHLATGAAALMAARTSEAASRKYFQVFGVVYGLVTLLGFMSGDKDVLGVMANNMADNLLHLGITVLSLVLGFGGPKAATPEA
jgi:hypothetical protein